MMTNNKIFDTSSWDLHQLARAVAQKPNDIQHSAAVLQEAVAWVKRLEQSKDPSTTQLMRSVEESLQIALIAASDINLGLFTAVASILTPPFLAGLMHQDEIVAHFGSESAAILVELLALQSCKIQHNTIRNYPNHPNIDSPHIIAILMQICEIIRVHCSGIVLERQDTDGLIDSGSHLLFELKCFYIPLVHRMRLYDIQTTLVDFWFKHADTLSYYVITAKLGMTKLQRQKKLNLISEEVCTVVKSKGIAFIMKKRIKSVYSIWNKIQNLKVGFDEIHDLSAIRIIVKLPEGQTLVEEKIICWKILGIISELYKPRCKVMRDWISTPRDNGYESLHLVFETDHYGSLEVQVRTERMDYIAEYGNAAHLEV